ncbi:MAG: hypothetical protein ABIF40_00190 [archaeon]
MIRKKGQASGIEISIFITLLALFILVYVLLIPPAERAALLDGEVIGDDDSVTIGDYETVLLSESPGDIHSYKTNVQKSSLESMHLYSQTGSETENIISALTVSRTLFKDNYKQIFFDVDDLNVLDSLHLLFLITDAKGEMTIQLNGRLVFEGELISNQLPIDLPVSGLVEGENELRLSVNSPGWALFSANRYRLEDVSLIREIIEEENEATRTFYIDSDTQIKSASLNYFLTCNTVSDEGTVTIYLNNYNVFNDRVFCSYLEERELILNKNYFIGDINTLMFTIDEGNFNIEEIEVELELEESSYPTYSFDIDTETYTEILSGEKEVSIAFSFEKSGTKKASVSVQDSEFSFDTSATSYTKVITSMIDNGANTIKVVPKVDFKIKSLMVYVE